MAVRVRIRIEPAKPLQGSVVETSALVNSGFESETGECSLPKKLAEQLGLWPPDACSELHTVRGYAGQVQVVFRRQAVTLQVITNDRAGTVVVADVIISANDDELILSDTVAERLGIMLVRPGKGIWCFQDETPSPGRPGHPPQFW
jgi:predicted aspartyl protease